MSFEGVDSCHEIWIGNGGNGNGHIGLEMEMVWKWSESGFKTISGHLRHMV